LLSVDPLGRRARAAPEPRDRRHHRRPDQLGDDAEGQPPAGDRGGHGPGIGGLPDRPRPEPRRAGRRGRKRPAGPAARPDGWGPGHRGLAAPGGRGQPRRPRLTDGRGGRRAPPRPGGHAHRPRRDLGRSRRTRLARDGAPARPEAHRLPARALPPRRGPRRRPPPPDRLRSRCAVDLRRPARPGFGSPRRLTPTGNQNRESTTAEDAEKSREEAVRRNHGEGPHGVFSAPSASSAEGQYLFKFILMTKPSDPSWVPDGGGAHDQTLVETWLFRLRRERFRSVQTGQTYD